MKLYDIVFSPTGGTKKVADYLIDALEGDVTTVDLTDSKQDFHAVSLTKEDVAVISVPSYGGRVPAVAVERLGMVHGDGARAVLVCVYGNRAYRTACRREPVTTIALALPPILSLVTVRKCSTMIWVFWARLCGCRLKNLPSALFALLFS
jgi:hypothetical protein